ncbi:MAG: response regulator [Deltaproteobacteria bacterium]|nr:response regulator [Deltaproteobacteria bacterium]
MLLAEDDRELRQVLTAALEGDGYEVLAVETGDELAKFITEVLASEQEAVDLIVSDFLLPGWTGLQALAALRTIDWTVPVILITAYPDVEVRRAARRLGVTFLFEKPFELEDLRMAAMNLVAPS